MKTNSRQSDVLIHHGLRSLHCLGHRQGRRELGEKMPAVWLYLQSDDLTIQLSHLEADQAIQPLGNRAVQRLTPVLGTPAEVVGDVVDCVSGWSSFHALILAQTFCLIKQALRQREEERHSPPR